MRHEDLLPSSRSILAIVIWVATVFGLGYATGKGAAMRRADHWRAIAEECASRFSTHMDRDEDRAYRDWADRVELRAMIAQRGRVVTSR